MTSTFSGFVSSAHVVKGAVSGDAVVRVSLASTDPMTRSSISSSYLWQLHCGARLQHATIYS